MMKNKMKEKIWKMMLRKNIRKAKLKMVYIQLNQKDKNMLNKKLVFNLVRKVRRIEKGIEKNNKLLRIRRFQLIFILFNSLAL